jgi:acetylornithine deacetylase/succinyl-diaminopimelate desuccinylase-like protein
MQRRLLLALLAILCAGAGAPSAARRHRQDNERAIIDEFIALLSIPNVARDLGDMRRNAGHIEKMFARRGVRTRRLEVPGAPPALYGEIVVPGARQTVLFYAHYDGQPVEPRSWVGHAPFRPLLRDGPLEGGGKPIALPAPGRRFGPEWRLYARSASDDKAPIMAWMVALDALRAARIPLRSNIKFLLDGEEEVGSPHLEQILRRHRDLLRADVWIFCDGPVHQSRRQQIAFGARGTVGFELEVYGARRELHSGHYGNWAPNPAAMLARLLASMRDDDGRVLVRGFYSDVAPLDRRERQALADAPRHDHVLKRELWLARTEGGGKRLEELVNLPALNIRGLSAGGVGEQARNAIPGSAKASIELRLVEGMDHRRTLDRVVAHIRAQGYHVVESEPDAATRMKHPRLARIERDTGYDAVRAPMDLPVARKVVRAVESARGGGVIRMPTLGGSLPLDPIDRVLRAPVIIVPIVNHDNNQHAHNENIRIRNLWDGIETMAALLAMD